MTKKQQGIKIRGTILAFIISYFEEHGYAPSYREIGEGVGLYSSASVKNQIDKMLDEGTLETDAYSAARALRVPGYKFVKEQKNGRN